MVPCAHTILLFRLQVIYLGFQVTVTGYLNDLEVIWRVSSLLPLLFSLATPFLLFLTSVHFFVVSD